MNCLESFKLYFKSVIDNNNYMNDFDKEISKQIIDQCKSFKDLTIAMCFLK